MKNVLVNPVAPIGAAQNSLRRGALPIVRGTNPTSPVSGQLPPATIRDTARPEHQAIPHRYGLGQKRK